MQSGNSPQQRRSRPDARTRPARTARTRATDSYTRALSSIPFQPGHVILTDKDDFASNQIQFLSLQKHTGIKIVHINNSPIGGIDLDEKGVAWAVRASPHYYNTPEEIDIFIGALKEIISLPRSSA